MSRVRLIATIFVLCATSMGVSCGAFHGGQDGQSSTSKTKILKSPSGRAEVRLRAIFASPECSFCARPYPPFTLLADVFDGETKVASDLMLAKDDSFGAPFDQLYTGNLWLSDSVVELGQKVDIDAPNQDVLIISNKSKGVVPYLIVWAGDYAFALVHVEPNASIKLPVVLPPESRLFRAQGMYADGTAFPRGSTGFAPDERPPGTITYELTLYDSFVVTDSKDISRR